MVVNIVLSDFVFDKLNLYLKYVGISRNACLSYFIGKQILNFNYRNEYFTENWRVRRYKAMSIETEQSGGHYNRFSINISDNLYDELCLIQDKLDVTFPHLTTNLIIMELSYVLSSYNKDFALNIKDVKKIHLDDKIPLSNALLSRIDKMSELLGMPRNALISMILTEHLIANYSEFDDTVYADDYGKNYYGIW